MRVVQTLACSQKQWWRSRKNPSECLLSRETACNNCWERRRHAWYTHYAHPHIMHTHTLYTPTHYAHRDMTCLLCSPPALPPSCSEHCTIIRNLMCVCVCVCEMPSSLTLSTSCSVVHPMWNNLRELLPPVPHNMPDLQAIRQPNCYQVFHLACYQLSTSLVSEV